MTPSMTAIPYDEAVARYDPVIGLETHVELGTATKMFCGSPAGFGAEPNAAVCPVCLGLPGSLPVVNRMAIEYAIRIGLALNCSIASWCRFARKNYFYPDMPKDYQISQYDEPLCTDGWLDIVVDGADFRIGIERVHLEEDTGKSLHVGGATGRIHGADYSLVDYNRAGIPLVEVVTKPVPGTGALAPVVARAYVTELREVLRALGVSDVRMEEGSLRCDVNTSLTARGASQWGTRTETKNVNSLRSVERAVRSEIERQAAVLDAGGRVVQETRHFHEDSGLTTPGRSKEEAQDYRYFPEPDLVPVAPSPEWVEELRATLPELPSARRERTQRLQRRGRSRGCLTLTWPRSAMRGGWTWLAETVREGADRPRMRRKWWLGELSRRANDSGVGLAELPVTPARSGAGSPQMEVSGDAQRPAGQAGAGRRAGRRGRPGRGGGGPRPRRGQRRCHPAGRRRCGHRGEPGRGGQDPRGQDGRGRRAGWGRNEGDPGPGRRRPGRPAHPGAPRPVLAG